MAPRGNALGDFLRARRDQVRPEDVGLVPGGHRRAPGLRREELAMLAGISAEYYLRLERGRAQHPSTQILEALARALQLDAKARQHLHDLAGPTEPDTGELDAGVRPLAELVDQFLMPAVVANRYLDVVAANPLARALSPEFTPGQNFLCWRLLDPAARELYVDWDEATDSAVSGFREFSGLCPVGDPRLKALLAQLSAASPRFIELWGRANVGYHRWGIHHMRHPQVGEIFLYRNRLNAPGPSGDHVIMYPAEPGSPSALALEELRSLSMPELGRTGAAAAKSD
ncbi:MAG TPA: helix-turn-helix transcriptional regulator [Mycobacterium sp.]|nr:helix-turn-helix transcriptional regulator [Mycobacterium sp.]